MAQLLPVVDTTGTYLTRYTLTHPDGTSETVSIAWNPGADFNPGTKFSAATMNPIINLLNTIISGETAVMNAQKLGGKAAANYAVSSHIHADLTNAINLKANSSYPTFTGNPVANGRYLSQMIIGSAVPNAVLCPVGCFYGQP